MQRAPLFFRVYKMKIRRILPQKGGMCMDYRTDLAMERTVRPGGMGEGVSVQMQQQAGAEVTWVRVSSEKAAERLGKAQGLYWTLTHPNLAAHAAGRSGVDDCPPRWRRCEVFRDLPAGFYSVGREKVAILK